MRVIASGLEWMGAGVGSIQTAVEELLYGSQFDVTVVTYSLTGGAAAFMDGIERCLERGIKVSFLINRFDAQVLEAIHRFQREVHTPGVYDLEVDTSLLSPGECAEAIRRHLEGGPAATAFQRLASASV